MHKLENGRHGSVWPYSELAQHLTMFLPSMQAHCSVIFAETKTGTEKESFKNFKISIS